MNLRFPSRYSLKVFSRSSSSPRMSSGELETWSFSKKGSLDRFIPVRFVYSDNASVIHWRFACDGVGVFPARRGYVIKATDDSQLGQMGLMMENEVKSVSIALRYAFMD